MTTRNDIAQWFEEGKALGATHMIVAVDTYDHEDYPVYVKEVPADEPISAPGGYERVHVVHSVRKLVNEQYSGQNMQRTMEVYKLPEPMEPQLNTRRCFNY